VSIRETRRWIVGALVLLCVIDLVACGVLLSPLAKSRSAREQDLRALQQELKDKERELGPSRGMEQKIKSATVDITTFYQQRLPAQYSQIDGALAKAAQTSGAQLQDINFKPDKKSVEDLQRVEIDMTISGPYVDLVKFINSVERDPVFFVIDSVSLAGSTNGVQLQVKAETYFRTGAV
jgi:Tfp pilus assembly protein PilO